MKNQLILFLILLITGADFIHAQSDTLFRVFLEAEYELGTPSGYINQDGDTGIPIGRYNYCYSDSAIGFVIVGDSISPYAINFDEVKLYDVYWYDMGPDPISDGLFRIIIDAKIGYADSTGKVIIEPQFKCTTPFKDGRAKVTYNCELVKDGEHTSMKSDQWFWINRAGKKIKD